LGFPVVYRTPSIKEDTWIYLTGKMDTLRIIFAGDKVIDILRFDDKN
jgi:hypothetical protein